MSQANVEIVRRWVGAYNRRDVDGLVGMTDADVVLDNSNAAFDGAVYRGHDGVREWFSWVQGMWKRQQIDPHEFISVGEDQVIAHVRLISVGVWMTEPLMRSAAVRMSARVG